MLFRVDGQLVVLMLHWMGGEEGFFTSHCIHICITQTLCKLQSNSTGLAVKVSSLSLKRHLQEAVTHVYAKISYGSALVMRASRNCQLLRTLDIRSLVPLSLRYGFGGGLYL